MSAGADETDAAEGPIPSGPWHGFYTYRALTDRHRMDLRLDFRGGRIDGSGVDDIGRFAITGTYDPESLRCRWRKNYLGAHTVIYEGAWDLGSIYGVWTIPPLSKGGFRIWPGARGEGEARYVETAEDLPVEDLEHVGPRREPGQIAPPEAQS